MKTVFSKYKTMAICGENALVYRKGALYRQKIGDKEKASFLCELPLSGVKRILAKIRLSERLLRLEPRVAITLDNDYFLLSCAGKIYRINVKSGELVCEFQLRKAMNNPLAFTRDSKGRILFGEYFSNNDHEEVCIFERDNGVWKKVYAFPPNTIYHIHGIVADEDDYYVLTGDDDSESAIWKTSDHFKNLHKVVGGKQEYRACVAFPYKSGLVYATDTPLKQNQLSYLDCSVPQPKSEFLYEMPGPCIYGREINGVFYFATSVEPDARYADTMRYRFTYKLGESVKDRYVHIISMTSDGTIEDAMQMKKDIWPMLLFQFGNASFPETIDNDAVVMTPISVKKYDGKTVSLRGSNHE